MKSYSALATTMILCGFMACDSGPRSPVGFLLPDGDVEQGKAAFIELECISCHNVDGVDLPPPTVVPLPSASVVLGGQVFEIRTDGYLVTSIIHPSHKLARGLDKEEITTSTGESRMPGYSDIMTVRQLIDLVAFLQSRYTVVPVPQSPL
jgi:mono/diheme cytochrome c family protein